jgi:hypothetical protein
MKEWINGVVTILPHLTTALENLYDSFKTLSLDVITKIRNEFANQPEQNRRLTEAEHTYALLKSFYEDYNE